MFSFTMDALHVGCVLCCSQGTKSLPPNESGFELTFVTLSLYFSFLEAEWPQDHKTCVGKLQGKTNHFINISKNHRFCLRGLHNTNKISIFNL